MTDTTNAAPAAPMTLDQARMMVAEADAAAAAERQAKADAADKAVRDLVTSEVFKQAHAAFEATLEAAPKNTEVQYAVTMMDRLLSMYPAA